MSKHTVGPEDGAMITGNHKTRRAALRTLVGASALAVPIVAASASVRPDAILAAIERHRSAYQSLNPSSRIRSWKTRFCDFYAL